MTDYDHEYRKNRSASSVRFVLFIGGLFFFVIKGFSSPLKVELDQSHRKRNAIVGLIIHTTVLIGILYWALKGQH